MLKPEARGFYCENILKNNPLLPVSMMERMRRIYPEGSFNESCSLKSKYWCKYRVKGSINRNDEILKFNERVCRMAYNLNFSFNKRMEFIKIFISNMDEFISVRYPRIEKDKFEIMNHGLCDMMSIGNKIYYDVILGPYIASIHPDKLPPIDYSNIVTSLKSPYDIIEDRVYIIELPHGQVFIRAIKDRSFEYKYHGESTTGVMTDIEKVITIKDNNHSFIYYISKIDDNPELIQDLHDFGIDYNGYRCIVTPIHMIMAKIFMRSVMLTGNNKPDVKSEKSSMMQPYLLDHTCCDVLIKTPYNPYTSVLSFIEDMCKCEGMDKIYISLYRVSKDSIIIQHLKKAASLGIKVYIYMEITARGDEESNLNLLKEMNSIPNIYLVCNYFRYKVHLKACLGIKKDGSGYAHIGTGNYNEKTATMYTDYHLITTDRVIISGIIDVFVTVFTKDEDGFNGSLNSRVFTAPDQMSIKIINMINIESRKGKDGLIMIKCNHLMDPKILMALINARNSGCEVILLTRTCCGLRSDKKNLHVFSKIGEYLEHGRLYIFGHPSKGVPKVFISSADMLTRNLERRVELMVEITDPSNISELITSFCNDIGYSEGKKSIVYKLYDNAIFPIGI